MSDLRPMMRRGLAATVIYGVLSGLYRLGTDGHIHYGMFDIASLFGLWLGVALMDIRRWYRGD